MGKYLINVFSYKEPALYNMQYTITMGNESYQIAIIINTRNYIHLYARNPNIVH